MNPDLAAARRILADRDWFEFDELSPQAKQRAITRYAENWGNGYDWWDYTYEDAIRLFALMGVDTDEKQIYFSGFASQGDGACFEGQYSYCRGAARSIAAEAPQDKELLRVATALQAIQRRYFYSLTASMKHTGRYCHEHSVTIEVGSEKYIVDVGDAECVRDALRALMRWLYKQLEAEYEYQSCGDGAVEYLCGAENKYNEEGDEYEPND